MNSVSTKIRNSYSFKKKLQNTALSIKDGTWRIASSAPPLPRKTDSSSLLFPKNVVVYLVVLKRALEYRLVCQVFI